MYNTSKEPVWYGELRTVRGNTILIHDKDFPEASAGRVYFYNTLRDAVIEYAEDIVKVNLHDLNDEEIKTAKAEFEANWLVTRDSFMQQHAGWVEAIHAKPTPAPKKAKPEPEVDADDDETAELEVDSLDDGFDDWSDDDDRS
ncbi:hypothetical protein TUM4644_04790 [Shewanella colwelliana]|uniref:Uncharacterized protein n=1 Tax=Shewanella colwelliana TaxID=23 RepID=A0A1E5IUJ7_SHECO|nr:hypothetical protein [Shewanella colwelliana]MDX1282305.1 hypothetical protein [Shewanella colwelliana]OEG74127.1 hypothetical protein BEL05_00575 [Shewanella colwelliana]GIU18379.1 hypothetical protein TUM4644_04790 [Shewanella colwelliana]